MANLLARIRETASTITALGTAGAVLWGVYVLIDPVLAAALAGGLIAAAATIFGRIAICQMRRIANATESVEWHLRPNGHEQLLPDKYRSTDPRGTPARDLIITAVVGLDDVHKRLDVLEAQGIRTEGAQQLERVRVRQREIRLDED